MPTRSDLKWQGYEVGATEAPAGHNVVAFRRRPPERNRLSMGDRMTALRWADQVTTHGYSKIVFDTACEQSGHEPGDFMLIYPRGEMWARFGIACGSDGLMLWHASTGATLGTFLTMGETLAAVPQAVSPD